MRPGAASAGSHRLLLGHVVHGGVFFGLGFAGRVLLTVALGKSLSPADYGVYGLVAAVVTLSTGLLPLGAHHYILREVPGARPREAAALFKSVTGMQVLLVSGVLLVVLPILAGVAPIAALFALADRPGLIVLIGAVLFTDCLTSQLARFLFARRDIEQGNVVLFLETGLRGFLAGAVLLLGTLTLSRVLALWAASLAVALAYAVSRLDLREVWTAPFEPRRFAAAVRFGFPLLPAHLMNAADAFARFFLASYHSTEAMGVYAYHENIVLMIALISFPVIARPLEPHVVAAFRQGDVEQSGRLLGVTLRYRLALVIPVLVVTIVWGDAVVRLLAQGAYVASPWLLLALAPVPVLMTISSTFERTMFLERRTGVIGRCHVLAAAAQFLLSLVLIPLHPLHGAALALTGGHVILTALLWRHYRRATVSIELALVRTALATVPCVGVAWIMSSVAPSPAPVSLLVAGAAVVAISYVVFASVFRVLPAAERRWLRGAMVSGGRRVLAFLGGR